MTIYIEQGDIVMINHHGDNQESLRHPLLVLETNVDYFIALQITAPKFDQEGNPTIDNEFLIKIYQEQKYIQCYPNEGFKYVSWVLLNKVYQVPFGNNKYEVSKVSHFSNEQKFKEIIKKYKLENGIPLNFLDIFDFSNY